MKCPNCQHEFRAPRKPGPEWPVWIRRADSREKAETAAMIAADSPCDNMGGTYTAEEVEVAFETTTEVRISSYVGDDGVKRWWINYEGTK